MTKELNDSLDSLFAGDTGPVRVAPVRDNAPEFKSAVERFEESCPKCRGRGRFISYAGRDCGPCFTCKGAGKKVFKSSSADRAKARESAATRKANREAEILQAWINENPAEHGWLVATAPRWNVAADLLAGLQRYGSLTEKQVALIRNGIARDAARNEARTAKAASAPAVDNAGIDRLKAAFDSAIKYQAEKGLTLRTPKITIGGVTISPAGANSKNPGSIYVKAAGEYLGKITAGQFHATQACDAATSAKVLEFIANPQEAAKVYGQTTGVCCICNATLKSKWKHLGIGPICSQKYGW
jgi:hypothetical protein